MKLSHLLVMVATLTGCFDLEIPEISINCSGGGNSLMCSWFGKDAGQDAGDSGAIVADSGIDAATDYFLCIHIMGHA